MRRVANRVGTVVAGLICFKLVNLILNVFSFPKLQPATSVDLTGVALLIPMRDEALRLPATLFGLITSGAESITFLDDGSTDGSAELAAAAAQEHGVDIRIITGDPRPPQWAGKTWACAQLAESTGADLLVFCDADVQLAAGALPAAVAEMRRQDAGVFSVFPGQQVRSWPERMLIPLIDNTLLCYLPFQLLSAPVPAAATANGSLLAFTSRAYRELDPFVTVKDALVEDVSIARLTRANGVRLGLALGGNLVRVRMFADFPELVRGLGRGLSPIARTHPVALVSAWLAHVLMYTLPLVLAVELPIWRLCAALGITERLLIEAKTGGRDWTAAVTASPWPLMAAPVVIQALRKTQTWKDRSYQ